MPKKWKRDRPRLRKFGRNAIAILTTGAGAYVGGAKGAKIANGVTLMIQGKRQIDQKIDMTKLDKLKGIPGVINAIFDGKKTYIFAIVTTILAVFQPELLANLIYAANQFKDTAEGVQSGDLKTLDPEIRGFIAFIMQAIVLLRGWRDLFGKKEEVVVFADGVGVDDFRAALADPTDTLGD